MSGEPAASDELTAPGAQTQSERRPGGDAGTRSRSAEREALAAAALRPLLPNERPPALLVAAAVCVLLAFGVIAGALSVHDLARRGGSLAGAAFIALILLALAQGMYRQQYWAVVGFEALLAFQIIVTSLALVVASTLLAAAVCVLSISLSGWLFWKLIRVMGRIQAGERIRAGHG